LENKSVLSITQHIATTECLQGADLHVLLTFKIVIVVIVIEI